MAIVEQFRNHSALNDLPLPARRSTRSPGRTVPAEVRDEAVECAEAGEQITEHQQRAVDQ
jgi:hypothetical protein